MPRLIWVFAGRTCHFVGFVMRRLIFHTIVNLSCCFFVVVVVVFLFCFFSVSSFLWVMRDSANIRCPLTALVFCALLAGWSTTPGFERGRERWWGRIDWHGRRWKWHCYSQNQPRYASRFQFSSCDWRHHKSPSRRKTVEFHYKHNFGVVSL